MVCPFCNRDNRATAKICGYCGRALPQAPGPGPTPLYSPTPAPPSRMEQIGLSPRNVGVIGVILLALLVISGAVFIVFQQVANQQASSATPTQRGGPTPTQRGGPTPTRLAAGSPIPSAVVALSPVPPTLTPAATPVMTATVSRRLDNAGPRRNVLNVTDVATNKSTPFFTSPGVISGMIFSAAWSPDGKKVLLSHNWKSSDYDYGYLLSILNEDGGRVADIIRTAPTSEGINADYAYRDAIWSPDGARIAVRFQSKSEFGIWVGNADGTDLKRLVSSDIGDWPRYWSVDGRWVVGVSSRDGTMYGVSVQADERVPFAKIKGIQMYNERYFPWRITDDPKCNVSGAWFNTGGAYWDCD